MTRRTSAYGTPNTRLSQSRRNSHGDLYSTADMMQQATHRSSTSTKMGGANASSNHNNDLERFSNGDVMSKRDTSRKRYPQKSSTTQIQFINSRPTSRFTRVLLHSRLKLDFKTFQNKSYIQNWKKKSDVSENPESGCREAFFTISR